jgi:hypothetical protein
VREDPTKLIVEKIAMIVGWRPYLSPLQCATLADELRRVADELDKIDPGDTMRMPFN